MLTPSDSIMNFTELLRSSWPEWGCLSSEPRVPRDDSGSNNLVKQRAPRSLSTSEACLPLPPSLIHSLPHLITFFGVPVGDLGKGHEFIHRALWKA